MTQLECRPLQHRCHVAMRVCVCVHHSVNIDLCTSNLHFVIYKSLRTTLEAISVCRRPSPSSDGICDIL